MEGVDNLVQYVNFYLLKTNGQAILKKCFENLLPETDGSGHL